MHLCLHLASWAFSSHRIVQSHITIACKFRRRPGFASAGGEAGPTTSCTAQYCTVPDGAASTKRRPGFCFAGLAESPYFAGLFLPATRLVFSPSRYPPHTFGQRYFRLRRPASVDERARPLRQRTPRDCSANTSVFPRNTVTTTFHGEHPGAAWRQIPGVAGGKVGGGEGEGREPRTRRRGLLFNVRGLWALVVVIGVLVVSLSLCFVLFITSILSHPHLLAWQSSIHVIASKTSP